MEDTRSAGLSLARKPKTPSYFATSGGLFGELEKLVQEAKIRSSALPVYLNTPSDGSDNPTLLFQNRGTSAVCAGLQSGQFPATTGSPEKREPLVSDHIAGEIDQDRSEDCQSRSVRQVSVGGSGGSPSTGSGNTAADRTVETTTRLADIRMIP